MPRATIESDMEMTHWSQCSESRCLHVSATVLSLWPVPRRGPWRACLACALAQHLPRQRDTVPLHMLVSIDVSVLLSANLSSTPANAQWYQPQGRPQHSIRGLLEAVYRARREAGVLSQLAGAPRVKSAGDNLSNQWGSDREQQLESAIGCAAVRSCTTGVASRTWYDSGSCG